MRCPKPDCGLEGTGQYCHKCGSKMEEAVKPESVVICNGRLDNGSPCNSELVPGHTFCSNCGSRVDESSFVKTLNEWGTRNKTDTAIEVGSSLEKHADNTNFEPTSSNADLKQTKSTPSDKKVVQNTKEYHLNPMASNNAEKIAMAGSLETPESTSHIDSDAAQNTDVAVETNNNNKVESSSIFSELKRPVGENKNGVTAEKGDIETNNVLFPPNISANHQEDKKGHFYGDANITFQESTERVEMEKEESKYLCLDDQTDGQGRNICSNGGNEHIKKQKGNMKEIKMDADIGNIQTAVSGDISGQSTARNKQSKDESKGKTPTNDEKNIDKKGETTSYQDKHINVDMNTGFVFGAANENYGLAAEQNRSAVGKELFSSTSLFDVRCKNGNAVCNDNSSDTIEQKGENSSTQQDSIDSSTDSSESGYEDAAISVQESLDEGTKADVKMDAEGSSRNKTKEKLETAAGNSNNQPIEGTDVDNGRHLSKGKSKRKKKKGRKKKKREQESSALNTSVDEKSITRSETTSDTDTILVKFHVLISERFEFDPEKQKIKIVMGNKEMGGWNKKDREMTVKRKIEEHVYEFGYEIRIPKRLISGGNNFPYKYSITREGKDEKFEYYTKKGNTGEGANRELSLNNKFKNLDIWHQFDGFIEKEPDLISMRKMKEVAYYKGDFKKNAKTTINVFCPTVSSLENETPADSLRRIEMLLESLKMVYFLDARCWGDNCKEFHTFFGNCLMESMFQHCGIDRTTSSNEDREYVLYCAMLIVCTLNMLEISIQDNKLLSKLCKTMLITADKASKTCSDYCFVESKFKEQREFIVAGLLFLVKELAGKTKDPSWLFLMPWIHLLSSALVPFETKPFDVSHDSETPTWWGISEIANEVEKFKNNYREWTTSPVSVLTVIEPLFDLDYLLPRTFMAAVDHDLLNAVIKTGSIPVEVCLANLTYHVKVERPQMFYYGQGNHWKYPVITYREKKLFEGMQSLLGQLTSRSYSEGCGLEQLTLCYVIAASLFEEATKGDRADLVCSSIHILIHCLAIHEACLTTNNTTETVQTSSQIPSATKSETYAITKALQWMGQWQTKWDSCMENILQTWDRLFAPDELPSKRLKDGWNKAIAEQLVNTLMNQVYSFDNRTRKLIEIYCRNLDKFCPKMQECLSETALTAIARVYSFNYHAFSEDESRRHGELLSNLFETEWDKQVKDTEENKQSSVLRYVLSWEPFPHFLKKYYMDKALTKMMLRPRCIGNLQRAASVIEEQVTALQSGTIPIGCLNFIESKVDKFSCVAGLVQTMDGLSETMVTKLIRLRCKEIAAFTTQLEKMTFFGSLCQHLPKVNKKLIEVVQRKQDDIDAHAVKEFCIPSDVRKIENLDTFTPMLCAFNLPDQMLKEITELYVYNRSSTFLKLWTDKSHTACDSCLTLEDALQKVWLPVKESFDVIKEQIRSGDIKFRDFEKNVGSLYKEDLEKIKEELQNMRLDDQVIMKRVDQLDKYRQMNMFVKGATTMLNFSEAYKLNGDFKQIKTLAKVENKEMKMKSFNEGLMETSIFLEKISSSMDQCLTTFLECEDIVKWLKEVMKDGLKELNVFVDIVSASAGDEPLYNARVQCLHLAVTGYAPLIFDLNQTDGYKELVEHCKTVWNELNANPNLPAQLKETNVQLEWLKEIHKSQGSVEITSRMQAEAINKDGIYTIGKNAWRTRAKKRSANEITTEISTIMQLTVLEPNKKGQNRNYTFSQLQDLQSRLMLVTGKADKGKDSVERFTMVFDSIKRLCNVYMKLCSSGCVLFKDWSARFMCDPNPDRPGCIFLEFGQSNKAPQIKGRRSQDENLEDMIPELAKFMERCFDDWLAYINKKRKKYLHLNYFTIDQLVILQSELVKFGMENQPDHRIYPLLCVIKDECSPGDIVDSMRLAKKEVDGNTNMEDKISGKDVHTNAVCDEKKEYFITELVKAGYSSDLAIRASEVDSVDLEDISAGISWCMDHDDDEDIDMPEDYDQTSATSSDRIFADSAFSGWSQSQTDIQTLISESIAGIKGNRLEGCTFTIRMFLEEVCERAVKRLSNVLLSTTVLS